MTDFFNNIWQLGSDWRLQGMSHPKNGVKCAGVYVGKVFRYANREA